MRILVTGATGFVGGALARRLIDEGDQVRALVRKATDDARVPAGVEIAVGALHPETPDDSLVAALGGVDCVVHAAGGGRARAPSDFYVNNTATTQALLDACGAAGSVARFVLVSSVAAKARVTHYGKSKALAEQAVLQRTDLKTAVVRPPAVYGPGDDRMLPLFEAAARGIIPRTSALGTRMSFVHVDDCASALACVTRAGAGTYECDDGPPRDWAALAAALGQALDRPKPPRLIGLPRPLLLSAAILSEAYGRASGRAVVFTRDKVAELTQTEPATDSARLRGELGWSHTVAFVDGARDTARWYRQQGRL